ncbi:uncharacterized protein F4822DRAFT_110029 [Hypoxylon trugodes]|uniref:uncharacterized protein n=1 Tax=Hypoxylon trugodes TaxID=326681 RepID=UPI00219D2BFD|nr:uncharacterized protein F4822DRAFT_110029 [Hypoxylon trugodes]KAI1391941.1 hypothetical protein F4822DRAFT_110029 [Hypoxylon trugodes]
MDSHFVLNPQEPASKPGKSEATQTSPGPIVTLPSIESIQQPSRFDFSFELPPIRTPGEISSTTEYPASLTTRTLYPPSPEKQPNPHTEPDFSDVNQLVALIRENPGFFKPIPSSGDRRSVVETWYAFLKCPMHVSNNDLERVIRMEHFVDNVYPRRFFYLKSWALRICDLVVLENYLKNQEKTFEELRVWYLICRAEGLGVSDRLIVRYIGYCEYEDGQVPPSHPRYEHLHTPLKGVLPEFLTGIEAVLPEVAESVQTHLLPHHYGEKTPLKRIGAAWIEFFGVASLINRLGDESPGLLPGEVRMSKHGSLDFDPVSLAILPRTLSNTLEDLFAKMCAKVQPSSIPCPRIPQLEMRPSRIPVLQTQSTPLLYKGLKTLVVLAGRDTY